MWRLNKFCCCGSIRTGSFIVGILELLFSILTLFPSIGYLMQLQYDPEYRKYLYNDNSMFAFAYWNLGYVVISIIVYAQTVYGINKDKQLSLLPYMLFNGFNLCLSVPIVIMLIIQSGPTNLNTMGLIALVLFAILTAIKLYFWLIIYSYYHKIREEKYNANLALSVCTHSNEHNINNEKCNVQKLIV